MNDQNGEREVYLVGYWQERENIYKYDDDVTNGGNLEVDDTDYVMEEL